MRISSLAPLLLLAACGGAPQAGPATGAAESEQIGCALDGAAELAQVCTLERQADGDGAILTLHRPDGGFHRLRQSGGALTTADGAEAAVVTPMTDGSADVAIAGTRYRVPPAPRP